MNQNPIWSVIIMLVATGPGSCQTRPDQQPIEPIQQSSTVEGDGLWSSLSTFAGRVPCASCRGIEMTLQLKPEGVFFLKSMYLEVDGRESRTVNRIGRWALTPNDEILVVRDENDETRRFQVVNSDTLRMLDALGKPIGSELPYELVRIPKSDILTGPVRLKGMYRYMADAAIFESCQTRMRYPVVFEEDHVELERAYLAANEERGSPMLASFIGRIEHRPRMEGEGERAFVVVSDFIGVSPGEQCYERELPLAHTQWRLVELSGRPISVGDRSTAPQLVLIPDDRRAEGSVGCNRYTASYEISGDSLRFYQVASTKRACPKSMDLEAVFMRALEAVSTFDHFGDRLELYSNSRLMARLRGISEIED